MNKVVAFVFIFIGQLLAAQAQLSLSPLGTGGPSHFRHVINLESTSLADYQLTTSNPFVTPANNGIDIFGRTWINTSPSIGNLCQNTGGSLLVIYLGNETNWIGSIGFSYSGDPVSDGYTIATTDAPCFGDSTAIHVAVGMPNFDLWISGRSAPFNLLQQPSTNVHWTRDPLVISTYIEPFDYYLNVDTWIASVDEPTDDPDCPTSNYRFALQIYINTGQALDPNAAVPEPSTYGIIAGCSLILLTVYRRRANHRR